MRNFLPPRSALLVALLASVAMAKEREAESRSFYLSESPRDVARPVYVTGEMVTVLRFQQPCTEAGTKMLGLDVPWKLKEVQLSAMLSRQSFDEPVRTGEKKEFALRMSRDEIQRGESGYIAVVADKSAFTSRDGPIHLALELFRQDGLQQAVVLLDHRIVEEKGAH
jgi:hypothetical protein